MAFHTYSKVDDTIVEEKVTGYDWHSHDLESIGKHCLVCNLKDFLPFNCAECKNIYCKDHWGSTQVQDCGRYYIRIVHSSFTKEEEEATMQSRGHWLSKSRDE